MPQGPPKKIAAISTVIWKDRPSHARTIVGKYLFGYNGDGRPPRPRSEVVSLFRSCLKTRSVGPRASEKADG